MNNAPVRQHPPHVRELDGIRALAIGLVFLTHLFATVPVVPSAYIAGLPTPFRVIAGHGWLGVDLFFVLSGYLITRILLDAKGRTGYFRSFYIRRLLRIAPLYYTVVIVLIAVYGYAHYATYWNFALALSANLSALAGGNVPQAAGPMWSLAVEEQFYLFWPFVVLMLSRRALAVFAVTIVVLEPFVRFSLGIHQMFYPWCRFDGLALGAMLALWFTSPRVTVRASVRLALSLAGAAAAIAVATAPWGGFGEGIMSVATRITEGTLVFGAIITALIAFPGRTLTAPLRSRPLRFIAELSFCLYLVHVPVVEAFQSLAPLIAPQLKTLDVRLFVPLQALVVCAVSIGIATLSRHFLELPFLRLKTVLTPSSESRTLRTEPAAGAALIGARSDPA